MCKTNIGLTLTHWKSKKVPEKHLLLLYWLLQSLWLCGSQQTVENSSRDPRPSYLPPEKSVCRSRSNNLVQNWEKSTSRLHIVTLLIELTCRIHHEKCWAGWSTSWNQDCWRNINNLGYTDDTTLMAESEELKSLLMKVKEESEKVGLKLKIQKTKIMASSPITLWQIDGETMETVRGFIFGGSKITAAIKLKDACSSEEKLWHNLDSILKSRDITLPTKIHLVKTMVFLVVLHGCESWTIKKELTLLNCWVGEDSWESLGLQGDQTSQS